MKKQRGGVMGGVPRRAAVAGGALLRRYLKTISGAPMMTRLMAMKSAFMRGV